LVRKKSVGLRRFLEEQSGFLERFGERKMMGSMFSELSLSASKASALRLLGKVRVESARGKDVRFMEIEWQLRNERDSGADRCEGDCAGEL
jgi:hypothetical protein